MGLWDFCVGYERKNNVNVRSTLLNDTEMCVVKQDGHLVCLLEATHAKWAQQQSENNSHKVNITHTKLTQATLSQRTTKQTQLKLSKRNTKQTKHIAKASYIKTIATHTKWTQPSQIERNTHKVNASYAKWTQHEVNVTESKHHRKWTQLTQNIRNAHKVNTTQVKRDSQ